MKCHYVLVNNDSTTYAFIHNFLYIIIYLLLLCTFWKVPIINYFVSDVLQQGASQFEQQATKLKRKMWWKNLKV